MMQQPQQPQQPQPPSSSAGKRQRKPPAPDYGPGGPFSLSPLFRAIDMVEERMAAYEEALAASDALTPKQREDQRRAYEMVTALTDPDAFTAAHEWFLGQHDQEGWDRQQALHLRRMERDEGRSLE